MLMENDPPVSEANILKKNVDFKVLRCINY